MLFFGGIILAVVVSTMPLSRVNVRHDALSDTRSSVNCVERNTAFRHHRLRPHGLQSSQGRL